MTVAARPTAAVELSIRRATLADTGAIAAIYNQGIEERRATFETRPQEADWAASRIASGELFLVAERDGVVVGFAATLPYSDRHYYSGVAEAMLYVDRSARRQGIGTTLLGVLADEAREAGLYKLIGKIFTMNEASGALVRRLGWREVGVHLRHGRLDDEWKDVLLVEKSLPIGR